MTEFVGNFVFRAWEADFDVPQEEPRGGTEIANGLDNYMQSADNLLEYHTGSAERFLTIDEEQQLATAIQARIAVQKEINEIAESDPAAAQRLEADHRDILEAGKAAEHTLVECNLRAAAYLARASMGRLTPTSDTNGKVGNSQREKPASSTTRRNKHIGRPYGDITKLHSSHADLEDRIQVANIALIQAARAFKPGITRDGQPVSFFSYATHSIHGDLSGHAQIHELPGWYVPTHVMEDIYRSSKHPEEFTPERIVALQRIDERRRTVPFDKIHLGMVAPEEIDDYTREATPLSLAEVIQDVSVDVEEDALMGNVLTSIIQRALRDLAIVVEEANENKAERKAREKMEVGYQKHGAILAMRFGLHNSATPYDEVRFFNQIGPLFGVTGARARQLESNAISRLRRTYSKALEGFLDNDALSPSSTHLPLDADVLANIRTVRTSIHWANQPLSEQQDSES